MYLKYFSIFESFMASKCKEVNYIASTCLISIMETSERCLRSIQSKQWRQQNEVINVILVFSLFRSSHRRCFVRKGVLRNFAKITGKRLCQGLFFNNVAGWDLSATGSDFPHWTDFPHCSGVFIVNFEQVNAS